MRQVRGFCRREEQQTWLLETVLTVWWGFSRDFETLWRSQARCGDAHPLALYPRAEPPDSPDGKYFETPAVVRC